jgi:NADPH:quinone reductase-like Zn-dependent oxidoreductase
MHLWQGENVLIHGGTSGVGSIGIQLLKAMGHDVYATAGSQEKCLAAMSFGANGCFRYDDPELKERVLNATGRRMSTAFLTCPLARTSIRIWRCSPLRGALPSFRQGAE